MGQLSRFLHGAAEQVPAGADHQAATTAYKHGAAGIAQLLLKLLEQAAVGIRSRKKCV